jgi:guanylate kinase|uniref:Guanylate kinase n=1 Tax=candidate division WOR-3 bacterium TaxID=2052148 RepID=A0A7V5Y0C5_UNCW3
MLSSQIFVLVGFSGSGKSTLIKNLLKSNKDLFYSVSLTTRKKRKGEKAGKDYHFVSEEVFKQLLKNRQILEWTYVYGNYYGTPKEPFFQALKEGKKIIMDLDINGAEKIKKRFKEKSKIILVLPPSFSELKERLKKREEKEIFLRLESDKNLWSAVLKKKKIFDYYLVNDHLKKTIDNLKAIIKVEDLKTLPKKILMEVKDGRSSYSARKNSY